MVINFFFVLFNIIGEFSVTMRIKALIAAFSFLDDEAHKF